MTFNTNAQLTFDNLTPLEGDSGDAALGLGWLIEDAEAGLGKAQRLIASGDIQAAIDTLHSIGNDLAGACWG